jgi:hypothetical protein
MLYIVVKDGKEWGVEYKGALINDGPMSLKEAKTLAEDCNQPESSRYADENILWE